MIGWRRVLSGLVLAAVVLAAAAAAALTKIPKPPTWAAAVIAAVAFVVGLVVDPFKKIAAEWIERPGRQWAVLLTHTRMHDRRGRLQRVRDCADPIALGVHPAEQEDSGRSGDRLPAYVERDVHAELVEMFTRGGLVVIEGASTAGKSRLAYQVMRAAAADRWLIVPAKPGSLAELVQGQVPIRNAVIWLDDLERYVTDGGLDGAVLDGLCASGATDVLALATLRAEAKAKMTAPGLETTTVRAAEEVMRRAHTITLSRELSQDERSRAEPLRGDERIAAALDQASGAGFAEYLAAGPAALERWQTATAGGNLTAGALITACIDARRAGHQTPIPRSLLERLHHHYLTPRDRYRTDLPTLDEAFTWAAQSVKGASACLTPDADDTYQPFDYLVDHTQRTTTTQTIPTQVWTDLVAHAEPSQLTSIATAAYHANLPHIAEQAIRPAADTGHPGAMYNLGVLLAQTGRADEAEQWYRRATDTGHPGAMYNLGVLLEETGRADEAEQWYRRAADTGHPGAMSNLGVLLKQTGRADEAEQWYRRAADTGHTNAMSNLGVLLEETGRADEAEQWYRRAADTGHTNAMYNLGVLLKQTGRADEAEQWWRRAADTGHPGAMSNLGVLLKQTGRADEAEQWYRRAAEDQEYTRNDK